MLLQRDLQVGQIYFILGKCLLQSESHRSQTFLLCHSYLMPDPQIGVQLTQFSPVTFEKLQLDLLGPACFLRERIIYALGQTGAT